MARDHARIMTKIWRNEEFRALPAAAQNTYFTIVSQDALTYAGCLDYRPGRLAALAGDQNAKKVETSVRALEHSRFLVVDRDTEELLVRTYVRHDGILARVNMGKALGRAVVKIVSTGVREALLLELAKDYRKKPQALGWVGLSDLYPDVFAVVADIASTLPMPTEPGM